VGPVQNDPINSYRVSALRLRRLSQFAIASLALIVGTACVTAFARGAQTSSGTFETKAARAILMDADEDLVLFEKDADSQVPPASMAKMMTLAIAFRELKAGKITLDTEYVTSEHAWRTGGAPSGTAAMFAPLGKPVSVGELIPAITVQVANDACIILAEGLYGSEDAFAQEMNRTAKELGLEQSVFKNASGLPADGEVMTVRDLATLARHLIYDYPEYYPYFSQKEFRYRDKFTFYNRNPLVFAEIGVDGLATGYVKDMGYGIVVSAKRGDQRLIAVLDGLASTKERDAEARRILDWGFKSFKPYRLFDSGEKVSDALVWGGTSHYVPLVGDGDINIILPTSTSGRVSASIIYNGPIKAPIKKGDQVAILRVTSEDSQATNEIPLYAGDDIGRSNFAMRGIDSLLVLAFGWLL
jgi:D-alanyl-D-alanine carboxypeptidase (penicillin-binding protein 5/6)